ncbi:MAG TPA: DUF1800 family protein, partial [Verrucomicrobiota bacterium]|nr:DUF1800 family protein [Verrucomicrobiota bacterium]
MLRSLLVQIAPARLLGVALLVIAPSIQSSAQLLDLNTNGMSDVWEYTYNAYGIVADQDSDADGVSNTHESVAGTNPADKSAVPQMAVSSSTNSVHLNMSAQWGKNYQLQSALLTGGGTLVWTNETNWIVRAGDAVHFTMPVNESARIYRMSVTDVDTDGDGINDWEEYMLGLDPFEAASNGKLDDNGQPLNDHDYATTALASQNVITIHASDPTATQPDPGETATGLGAYTILRGGFPLNSITVNLALDGPAIGIATEGVDHEYITRPVVLPAGVSAANITLTPKANTNRVSPVIATLKGLPGANYQLGNASNASVVIYPTTTPTGSGLLGQYYTNASTTYANSANFNPANHLVTRVDPVIDFSWGTPATPPITNNGRYTVRWTGQVQPQYSETYIFEVRSDDSAKLWVNDQLLVDFWQTQGLTSRTNIIALEGDVRYNIKIEYLCYSPNPPRMQLYWYSDSQPRQIIPSSRLYPSNSSPAAVTSPLEAFGFLGQPFSFTVAGANTPNLYSATGLPPGLNFNSTNGVISGVPLMAGEFQASLTASNAAGIGASVLNITVFDTGSAVSREVWDGVPGTGVADIPVDTPPTFSGPHGALQGVTDYGDHYAERIRGYITAPTTGNYYFWLAAADSAELWISNDSEPANKVRRAFVIPGGTAPQDWNAQPNQRSPWLALVAGRKYYVEILHKAGSGAGDNWAVAWRLDPHGTNTTPAEIVPGHVLSRHFDQPPAFIPGTLYGANMLAQAGAISSGVGSATLRVSADETTAVLKYSHTELSSPVTAKHIHSDLYKNKNNQGQIIFDIDAAAPQPDGSYVWTIEPVGTLSVDDIREIIKEGKSYINIHTVNYPNGEINGHFTPAVGSQSFSPPPPPPAWTDDHTSAAAAARFLIQSTFGPNATEIATVQSAGYEAWIDDQFTQPVTRHLPVVLAKGNVDPSTPYPGNLTFNAWWQQSVTAPDQLRQRVAFALSEIFVVSELGVLDNRASALSSYYDILLDHAFGNFRDLMEAVTLSPAMGLYLDMRRNEKGDIRLGRHPNENYAREILQLFSVGLYRMWPDGTFVMSSQGELVPTYGQDEILGFSRVFTGWNYWQTNQANGRLPSNWTPSANYTNPMVLVPLRHETGTKRVLDNVILPAAHGTFANPEHSDYDTYGIQDLALAHDSIFHNQNVGPYICRQLIQRLVTSHPSRDYLYRVVQKFNDNGAGVRGDMKAVIKAILLDYEARSTAAMAQPTFGKQREPLCRVTASARAFPPPPPVNGTYNQSGTQTITVTTAAPHRMNNNDDPFLSFTDTSGQPRPPSQGYNNVSVTSPTTFTMNAPGIAVATYRQIGSTLYVTNASHGLSVGHPVYLVFTTGGAASGTNVVNP